MKMDYDKTLNQLKEKLDKAKNLKIRAEAKLEQLNKQKQDILNDIQALGVKPEELDSEIGKLKDEIEELLGKTNEMLPADILR